MAEIIKCPVCGENNAGDTSYCQNCNSPLQAQNESLKSGELPDKRKNTAELEPILPQWLRDAREQSRQTQDEPQGMDALKSPAPTEPHAAPHVDFLAGLQSHTDDDSEGETPDWLASITGVSNKPKKTETVADVRWVEMGGRDDFAQDAPKADADKAVESLLAAGYYGEGAPVGAVEDKKVKSATVTGTHLCCGKCVTGIDNAVKTRLLILFTMKFDDILINDKLPATDTLKESLFNSFRQL